MHALGVIPTPRVNTSLVTRMASVSMHSISIDLPLFAGDTFEEIPVAVGNGAYRKLAMVLLGMFKALGASNVPSRMVVETLKSTGPMSSPGYRMWLAAPTAKDIDDSWRVVLKANAASKQKFGLVHTLADWRMCACQLVPQFEKTFMNGDRAAREDSDCLPSVILAYPLLTTIGRMRIDETQCQRASYSFSATECVGPIPFTMWRMQSDQLEHLGHIPVPPRHPTMTSVYYVKCWTEEYVEPVNERPVPAPPTGPNLLSDQNNARLKPKKASDERRHQGQHVPTGTPRDLLETLAAENFGRYNEIKKKYSALLMDEGSYQIQEYRNMYEEYAAEMKAAAEVAQLQVMTRLGDGSEGWHADRVALEQINKFQDIRFHETWPDQDLSILAGHLARSRMMSDKFGGVAVNQFLVDIVRYSSLSALLCDSRMAINTVAVSKGGLGKSYAASVALKKMRNPNNTQSMSRITARGDEVHGAVKQGVVYLHDEMPEYFQDVKNPGVVEKAKEKISSNQLTIMRQYINPETNKGVSEVGVIACKHAVVVLGNEAIDSLRCDEALLTRFHTIFLSNAVRSDRPTNTFGDRLPAKCAMYVSQIEDNFCSFEALFRLVCVNISTGVYPAGLNTEVFSIISSQFLSILPNYGVKEMESRNIERARMMAEIFCITEAIQFVFNSDYMAYRRAHEESIPSVYDLLQEVGPHLVVTEDQALHALTSTFHQWYPQDMEVVLRGIVKMSGYPNKCTHPIDTRASGSDVELRRDINRVILTESGKSFTELCSNLAAMTGTGVDPLSVRKTLLTMTKMVVNVPLRTPANEADRCLTNPPSTTGGNAMVDCLVSENDKMGGTLSISTGFLELMYNYAMFVEKDPLRTGPVEVDLSNAPIVDVMREALNATRHKYTRPCKVALLPCKLVTSGEVHHSLLDAVVVNPSDRVLNPTRSFVMHKLESDMLSVPWDKSLEKVDVTTSKPFEYDALCRHLISAGMPTNHQCPALFRKEINARARKLLTAEKLAPEVKNQCYPWAYAKESMRIKGMVECEIPADAALGVETVYEMDLFAMRPPETIDLLGEHTLLPRMAPDAPSYAEAQAAADTAMDEAHTAIVANAWSTVRPALAPAPQPLITAGCSKKRPMGFPDSGDEMFEEEEEEEEDSAEAMRRRKGKGPKLDVFQPNARIRTMDEDEDSRPAGVGTNSGGVGYDSDDLC